MRAKSAILVLLVATAVPAMAEPFFRLTRTPPVTDAVTDVASGLADKLFAAPFAADSTWNASIPASATYADVPGIANLYVGLSTGTEQDGVSVPVLRALATTRPYKVLYHRDAWSKLFSGAWKPTGNSKTVEAEILAGASATFPFPYHTYVSQSGTAFVLPSSYTPIVRQADGTPPTLYAGSDLAPSGNADSHMAVFQPDGRMYETYATIVLSNGNVVCLTYQVTDPKLAGDGFQNGITASMIPVFAGLIRKTEAASLDIDHAIKVVAPPSMLAPAFVYPALSFDRGALRENPPYSGTVPMGSKLAIPSDVDLDGLGLVSDAGRAVARAAQKHGFIVTDRGGSGVTLITEAGAVFARSSGLQGDLRRIMAVTKRVEP